MSVCDKCKAELENGTRFCSECGSDTFETIFCPECGAKTATEFAFCSECGKPLGKEPLGDAAASDSPEKKRTPILAKLSFKPLHLGIIAAVIVIVLAAIIAITSNSGSASGKQIIYVKDQELQLANVSNLKPFELTNRLFDDFSYSYTGQELAGLSASIFISENGRYIFYPDRLGENGASYYWRDLNDDNSKSDAATKIDSEFYVRSPYLTSDGSKFFYIKSNERRFYVFDRKSGEKNRLDDEVSSYYINETGDYLIYDKYEDGEYAIYEMTLNGLSGEKTKLDSYAQIQSAFAEDKKVYYLKEGTLYFKEFGKDRVKISSDVSRVISVVDGKSVYYLKTEEVTNRLADFINDDMLADDRNLAEPAQPNYPSEPDRPIESDYQDSVWVSSSWGSERHPETNERGNWSRKTNTEAYNAAMEQYQIRHAEWEIAYTNLQNEYEEAYNHYYGKQDRDELRVALEDEENAVTYEKYTLCYWTQARETLVASDYAVGKYFTKSSKVPIVVYQKYNTSADGKQKLSELLSEGNYSNASNVIWDLQNRISSMRNVSEEIYVASGEKESILECDNARYWSINQDGILYFVDDYSADKGYGTLISASVTDGTVAKPIKIDEDVTGLCFGNKHDNTYYFKDVKNGTGDIYLNGKIIATDIYTSSLYNYEGTDTLLYYTDYSRRTQRGTLCIYLGGKQIKIADDVSFFAPIDDKNIAYLADYNHDRGRGDLMLYNGEDKPVAVDSDVAALLWIPQMKWGNYSYLNWDVEQVLEPASTPAPAPAATTPR